MCGMFIVGAPVINAAPETAKANITLTVPDTQMIDADTAASMTAMFDNMLSNMNQNLTADQVQNIFSQADNGDVNAIAIKGFLYFFGVGGIEQDFHKAMTYLVQAAQQGHNDALLMVGAMYLSGEFGDEYVMQGIAIMEALAEKSHPFAMYMLAIISMSEGDFETASYWYNRVVAVNDPAFNQMLQMIHQAMLDTAEQGDAVAQASVAGMYLFGAFGFEENPKEAFKWCKRAAAQGEPEAILMLGVFYEEGVGTTKNTQKAIFYYSKAAEMGVEGAQEALDALKATIERR